MEEERQSTVRIIKFFVTLSLMLLFLIQCDSRKNSYRKIKINNKWIKVEVTDTPAERMVGLSNRYSLPENQGMLFVFPDKAKREFWMYKCNFDIDLAYIDASGIIREIITMKKEPFNLPIDSLRKYPSSSSEIKFAIEMKGGWFKEHNVEVGTQLDLKGFYSAY